MDKDNLITFPSKTIKKQDITEDDTVFVYNCKCFYDIEKGLREDLPDTPLGIPHSRFYILETGYECSFCGRFVSFEDVHGSIE